MKKERTTDAQVEAFYTTYRWRRCREAYAKSKSYLCERCAKEGRITQGEEVHHKIRLTKQNLNDPKVATSWDNLILLCEDCHKKEHGKLVPRWEIDQQGRVKL